VRLQCCEKLSFSLAAWEWG